jgi:hypothetical protein
MFAPPDDWVPTELDLDLRSRWLPSENQIRLADAALAEVTRDDKLLLAECVYTGHLLINKEYGFWSKDVKVVPVDGVFLSRANCSDTVVSAAVRWHDAFPGTQISGGYARHTGDGKAFVFEDILVQAAVKP